MARKKRSAAVTEMGDAELLEAVAANRQELFNLRFQLVTGQLTNVSRIKMVKKDIARGLTELREREIAAAEALSGDGTGTSTEKAS